VITAVKGAEALRIAAAHPGEIHLPVTDVVIRPQSTQDQPSRPVDGKRERSGARARADPHMNPRRSNMPHICHAPRRFKVT
jgi:hypothetical protein